MKGSWRICKSAPQRWLRYSDSMLVEHARQRVGTVAYFHFAFVELRRGITQ